MTINNKRGNSQKSGFKPITFSVTSSLSLLSFLNAQIPSKGKNAIKRLIANGFVSINNEIIRKFDFALMPQMQVKVNEATIASSSLRARNPVGIKIIFEDQDIVVIDKSNGLLSVATNNKNEVTAFSILKDTLRKADSECKLFIVHRLDRDTSGLMLFAKSQEKQLQLQENWNETVVERTYLAIVEGKVENHEGTIKSFLMENRNFEVYTTTVPGEGKEAITHYQCLKQTSEYSLLKVSLETGRKNQIRVHFSDLGHPVIGDKKYGSTKNPILRLGLHAQVLSFVHPTTQKEMRFETPLPEQFSQLFNSKKSIIQMDSKVR